MRYATGHFIDGEHVDTLAKGRSTAVNPATLDPIREATAGTNADIDRAVTSARRAFASGIWRRMAPRARFAVLSRLAHLIERNTERFALLDTL